MYGLFKDQNANGMIPNHCYSCLLFIFQGIDLCLFHTTALILFPSSCLEWLDPLCLLFLMTSTKEWWVELESLVDVGSKNVSLNSKVLFLQTLSCHPMKKKKNSAINFDLNQSLNIIGFQVSYSILILFQGTLELHIMLQYQPWK